MQHISGLVLKAMDQYQHEVFHKIDTQYAHKYYFHYLSLFSMAYLTGMKVSALINEPYVKLKHSIVNGEQVYWISRGEKLLGWLPIYADEVKLWLWVGGDEPQNEYAVDFHSYFKGKKNIYELVDRRLDRLTFMIRQGTGALSPQHLSLDQIRYLRVYDLLVNRRLNPILVASIMGWNSFGSFAKNGTVLDILDRLDIEGTLKARPVGIAGRVRLDWF